jgi:hypothetical protein
MAAGELGIPSPHCRAELTVQLAIFSALAAGKLGMASRPPPALQSYLAFSAPVELGRNRELPNM